MAHETKVLTFECQEDYVLVSLEIDLCDLSLSCSESLVLTPALVKDGRSAFLPRVVARGRNGSISENSYCEIEYYGKGKREFLKGSGVVCYSYKMPYKKWMKDSQLALVSVLYNKKGVVSRSVEIVQEQTMSIAEVKRVSSFDFIPKVTTLSDSAASILGSQGVENYTSMAEAIRYCNIEQAAQYISLFNVESNLSEELNIIGAYYTICENYSRAEEFFTMAVELGSRDAVQNLKYLAIKVKNAQDIEVFESRQVKGWY